MGKKGDKLTPKQKRFIEAYLETWNATGAARTAGYKNPNHCSWYLVHEPKVAEAIDARIKAAAMGADEVLARLAQQARVNIGDFILQSATPVVDKDGNITMVETTSINWDHVKTHGYLIRKLSPTANGVTIELHDGQTALIQLGKHLKLFTDNMDVTSGGKPIVIASINPDLLESLQQ